MNLSKRVGAFVKLGHILSVFDENMETLFYKAYNENNWFTQENIIKAFHGLGIYLNEENLNQWISKYDFHVSSPKNIGVIMAGNIPLAGFHDLLSILISNHHLVMKSSSQDNVLMDFVIKNLKIIEPEFEKKIKVVEWLNDVDAFIGTGSDNSAKYFRYYFGKKPHIIRQNRTSVAVITGGESEQELNDLGKDIFTYYGLGCRNVSKILVPENYDFIPLLDAQKNYESVGNHNKYRNNYNYNKSIYLVNSEPHLDTGFLLVRESKNMISPISVLFHQSYENEDELAQLLSDNSEKIQCVIGQNYIPFGKTQQPELWDYADGIDTLNFLVGLY